ncbi:palmitoyltransferase ZDHHC12 isoform X2 [Manis pentadactyla]|uniref:palmitoyltransferase ZDHHC12 isoform X2 n=1 Tax=Manis pentadactyla TaxID=143292 RepID=UPI00187347D5|nr:palmitoyltransferase ZDHHC12 isoform X2 [Manis pentadactyla]
MAPWALLSAGVLVRTAHTVLTWGVTLLLFLHDTALRQWEEQGDLLLPLAFLLLVLGSLLLYLAVSLMDPGYVNIQPQAQEEAKEEQTAMVPQVIPLRRCGYCLLLPLRARHCRECRRCVRRYDHHCPWMENCVGERNHPLFVAYLAVQLVVLLWGLYLAWWVLPQSGGGGGGRQRAPTGVSRAKLPSPKWPAHLGSLGHPYPPPALGSHPYSALQVWPPVLPALGAMAAVQRAPVCHLLAAVHPLFGRWPAPGLAPLPGGQQHYHLGVPLLAPHCLPPPAPRQPLRPWPDSQPGPLLLWVALGVLGDSLG